MNKKLLSLVVFSLLVSCGLFDRMPPDIARAGIISHAFVKDVRQRYPYYLPCGMGGAFCEQINGFLITFETIEDISNERAEDEMRVIYDMLTSRINNDEIIRPYLSEWPFENRETRIAILFMDPINGRFRSYPKVASISIGAGKMRKAYFYPATDRLMSMEEIQAYEAKEHPEGEKGCKVWER